MMNMLNKKDFLVEKSSFSRKIKGNIFSVVRRITKSKKIEDIYWRHFHGFNAANEEVTLPILKKSILKAVKLGTTEIGDYYEFGIFNGYTFLFAQKLFQELNQDKVRFFGFDSFKGLPKINCIDKTNYFAYHEGELFFPKERVIKNLNQMGVDWNKTFLIEGFFNESLTEDLKKKYNMKKISVALIDCDLYSSTVEVLDFIKDIIMDGTILIFDEYDSIVFRHDMSRGERKAFEEFLEKNKNISAEMFLSIGTGRAFIVSKK